MGESMQAVYLFFDNSGYEGKSGHALFKIDLPPMHSIKNSKPPPISINPVLELSWGEYPHLMSCAQSGSKLYFLGGFSVGPPSSPPPQGKNKDELTIQLLNHVLPPCVHIFDTTSTKEGMKLGPAMASGKAARPTVFVSKGMIYVLSSGGAVSSELSWFFNHLKTTDWLEDTGDFMGQVKLFERYDPVANKWQVLDDTPLHSMSYLKGYLLLEDQHKVVITSLQKGNVIHLVYDLDKDLWLSSSSLIPTETSKAKDMLRLFDNGSCQYVGGFCYGVLPYRGVFRLGPLHLNKDDEESKLSNYFMSLVNSHDVFLLAPPMNGTCKLQHLGGGYFILLSASQPLVKDNDDFDIPDRRVMINIFKELLPTAGGATTQVDTASSFNAKIVFSQNYVFKTNFLCTGQFLSCFLVQSPVPTKERSNRDAVYIKLGGDNSL